MRRCGPLVCLVGLLTSMFACGRSEPGSVAAPQTSANTAPSKRTGTSPANAGARTEPRNEETTDGRPTGEAQPKDYPLQGKVVKVNRETGIVAIRHEEIPDFMPAMTMPFDLKGQQVLEDLQPGDKVKGTLRVGGDETSLVDVEITEMARPGEDEASAGALPRRNVLKPGEPVPDFTMTTQDGTELKLSDLRGKTVVLTFIYTRCPLPNFCPLMDQKFAKLADMLKTSPERQASVRLLSVSFDPEHDTPEALAQHARLRGARPPLWTFAVASHDELYKVAESLGLTYGPAKEQIIHSLSTSVIGPDGKLVRLELNNTWSPADLFKTVASLLSSRLAPH